MIKIESKKKEKEEDSIIDKSYLIINGIPDLESFYSDGEIPYIYAHFYNAEVIKVLVSHSFTEIGKTFTNIGFYKDVEWWENSINIDVYSNDYYGLKAPCIRVNFQIQEWEHWAKPWSISSLANQFQLNVSTVDTEKIKYWQEDEETVLNGFGIEYYPENRDLTIENEISTIVNVLEKVVDRTNKDLLTSIDTESVLTYFQFPDEIKTAGKQYLIYFAQFIADLGILVDTEIKEELNYTLFKITPNDKLESLDKIREALNIYLNAPNDDNFEILVVQENDIAIKQWESNLYHLKSQLALAKSLIQAKDSTIETLQLSNYQYKQMLESHSAKKEADKEEIIAGIVSVDKYEGKGFTINLAEIFRRLKRKIN